MVLKVAQIGSQYVSCHISLSFSGFKNVWKHITQWDSGGAQGRSSRRRRRKRREKEDEEEEEKEGEEEEEEEGGAGGKEEEEEEEEIPLYIPPSPDRPLLRQVLV